MRIGYAFFARHVEVDPRTNCFSALSADFDSVQLRKSERIRLSIVAKLYLARSDTDVHSLRIDLTDADGNRVTVAKGEFTETPNARDATLESSANFCIELSPHFKKSGAVYFHIVVDESEVHSMPLVVEIGEGSTE